MIGDAGDGKTRLVRAFIDRHGDEADMIIGRCLPDGDGTTFWPARERVASATGIGPIGTDCGSCLFDRPRDGLVDSVGARAALCCDAHSIVAEPG